MGVLVGSRWRACSLTLARVGMSIFISDIGLIGMMSLLYVFGRTYGWKAFVAYYFIPYIVSTIHLGKVTKAYGVLFSCAITGMVSYSIIS